MIDTPIYRKINQALGQRKTVFIVITDNDFNKENTIAVCNEAQSQLAGLVVEILYFDINDKSESEFIKLLQIKNTTEMPLTLVINVQGIVTGKHTGIPEMENLVEDARKRMSNQCGCGCG